MKIIHAPPSPETLVILKALQKAVDKCLAQKEKLGHYAVVWRDGKPVKVGGDFQKTVE